MLAASGEVSARSCASRRRSWRERRSVRRSACALGRGVGFGLGSANTLQQSALHRSFLCSLRLPAFLISFSTQRAASLGPR
eukprot:402361-Pleurochrysis_carterae.AAC.1